VRGGGEGWCGGVEAFSSLSLLLGRNSWRNAFAWTVGLTVVAAVTQSCAVHDLLSVFLTTRGIPSTPCGLPASRLQHPEARITLTPQSTIATALEQALLHKGLHSYRLDGDNIRFGLNKDLGFDPASRVENVSRNKLPGGLMTEERGLRDWRAKR